MALPRERAALALLGVAVPVAHRQPPRAGPRCCWELTGDSRQGVEKRKRYHPLFNKNGYWERLNGISKVISVWSYASKPCEEVRVKRFPWFRLGGRANCRAVAASSRTQHVCCCTAASPQSGIALHFSVCWVNCSLLFVSIHFLIDSYFMALLSELRSAIVAGSRIARKTLSGVYRKAQARNVLLTADSRARPHGSTPWLYVCRTGSQQRSQEGKK